MLPNSTNSTNGSEEFSLCSRDGDNRLGAQLSILYYFMFVFSLLGNGLVLFIIYRFERLTTVINILLVNLVASSLIFMSSLPFVAVYMQISEWIFGSAMCKIVFSAYYMGFYSSVFFLTLLMFDQHLAVVYSLPAAHVRNRRYAVISCVVVWLVSGLACIRPMLSLNTFTYLNSSIHCDYYPTDLPNMDVVISAGFYIQLFVFFILPLAATIYCNVRITITVISTRIASKFKTVRLVLVIILLCFICCTPFSVIVVLLEHGPNSCEESQTLGYALQITRNMAYFYFCISPFFYTLLGAKFQDRVRHLLMKCFPGLRKDISLPECSPATLATKNPTINKTLACNA